MKDEEERGSAKLMEMLTGDKAELNEAVMSRAFGVSAEQFIIDRWWIKGQSRPEVFWATLRVKPEFVGFSGGEPLMYAPLRALLLHARALGMLNTVTTNGMLLDPRRIEALKGAAGLVAISLDGTPASHDRMRGHPRAFATMARRLPGLRAAGIPFGFIFTLTQFNLDEMIWAAEFALAQGARLLQVHPLEAVGRAQERLEAAVPDETELSYAVLAVARLKELAGDRLVIQLDVAGRDAMAASPEAVFAADDWPGDDRPLGDMLSPLIVEPDGSGCRSNTPSAGNGRSATCTTRGCPCWPNTGSVSAWAAFAHCAGRSSAAPRRPSSRRSSTGTGGWRRRPGLQAQGRALPATSAAAASCAARGCAGRSKPALPRSR